MRARLWRFELVKRKDAARRGHVFSLCEGRGSVCAQSQTLGGNLVLHFWLAQELSMGVLLHRWSWLRKTLRPLLII